MMARHIIRLLAGFLLMISIAGAAQAQQPLWINRTYSGEGYSVSMSSDGSSIAAAMDLFYLFNRKGERVWSGFAGKQVRMTGDGLYIVGATDSGIRYLDASGKTFWMDSELKPVDVIAMHPDGRFIAALSASTFSLYNRAGSLLARNSSFAADDIAIPPDGSMMVIATPSAIVGLNQSGFEKWSYATFENRKMSFAGDGSYIIGASAYSVVALHPSGNLLWTYRTASDILDIAISSNSEYIAVGSRDKNVYLLNRKGELAWKRALGDPVHCIAVSSDGSFIAAGSFQGLDKKIYLFSSGGDLLWTYQTGGWINGIALSGDGAYLAAVTDEGNLYYFDTRIPPTTPVSSAATTLAAPPIAIETPPPDTTGAPSLPPSNLQTTAPAIPETSASPAQPQTTRSGGDPIALGVLVALSFGIALSRVRRHS